jgi:hypothetical protein
MQYFARKLKTYIQHSWLDQIFLILIVLRTARAAPDAP